jgi:hypothetical protein
MTIFHIQLKTRRNQIVEVGVTVNALREIVAIETRDGEPAWEFVGELLRCGYADKVPHPLGDVYRIRVDRTRPAG